MRVLKWIVNLKNAYVSVNILQPYFLSLQIHNSPIHVSILSPSSSSSNVVINSTSTILRSEKMGRFKFFGGNKGFQLYTSVSIVNIVLESHTKKEEKWYPFQRLLYLLFLQPDARIAARRLKVTRSTGDSIVDHFPELARWWTDENRHLPRNPFAEWWWSWLGWLLQKALEITRAECRPIGDIRVQPSVRSSWIWGGVITAIKRD